MPTTGPDPERPARDASSDAGSDPGSEAEPVRTAAAPPVADDDVPAGGGGSAAPEIWFTAALEEYRSLRIEIVDAIGAQRRIMQLGVAGVSVLVGLGLQPINRVAAVVLLTVVVPGVALSVTIGALGELVRAVRASAYLREREEVIDRMVGDGPPAMDWERWLRDRGTVNRRDRAEFAVLTVVVVGAAVVAGFIGLAPPAPAPPAVVGTGLGVAAVLLLVSSWTFRRRMAEARTLFGEDGLRRSRPGTPPAPP